MNLGSAGVSPACWVVPRLNTRRRDAGAPSAVDAEYDVFSILFFSGAAVGCCAAFRMLFYAAPLKNNGLIKWGVGYYKHGTPTGFGLVHKSATDMSTRRMWVMTSPRMGALHCWSLLRPGTGAAR